MLGENSLFIGAESFLTEANLLPELSHSVVKVGTDDAIQIKRLRYLLQRRWKGEY
jgi:hypothetical protein